FPRRVAPELLRQPPSEKQRAQGMPGDDLTHGPPATKKAGGSYHRFGRINRHSLRNGVNGLYRARPGETGFCVTVTVRNVSQGLAPASRAPGPHALAVRVMPHVLRPNASIASRAPRLVTIGRTPLLSRRDGATIIMILRKTEEKYFRKRRNLA